MVTTEVVEMTSAEQLPSWPADDEVSLDELARRQGVKPIKSTDELVVPGLFDDDEEYEAFLDDLYASRRAGTE